MPAQPWDVTTLLDLAAHGDQSASDQLYARVYDELHTMARGQLRREHAVTLPPTGLVHEAWLRLADQHTTPVNRGHFFGIAAQAMRRVLADRARARRRRKRDGRTITLDDAIAAHDKQIDLIIAVDDAVERLTAIAPRQAKVVELRWFADLELEEVAEVLGVSVATVKREWIAARAWLHRDLAEDPSGGSLPG